KLDLATTLNHPNDFTHSVGVFLGNGNGTFRPVAIYPAGRSNKTLAVKDMNSDGKPDLVIGHYSDGTVSVLLGVGDGSFRPVAEYAAGGGYGEGVVNVAAEDVNSDGKPDVVAVSSAIDSPTTKV